MVFSARIQTDTQLTSRFRRQNGRRCGPRLKNPSKVPGFRYHRPPIASFDEPPDGKKAPSGEQHVGADVENPEPYRLSLERAASTVSTTPATDSAPNT